MIVSPNPEFLGALGGVEQTIPFPGLSVTPVGTPQDIKDRPPEIVQSTSSTDRSTTRSPTE